jgi:hypothetical protein
MRLIKEAIQDPEERQDDETLMATLVLHMVEAILVTDIGLPKTTAFADSESVNC